MSSSCLKFELDGKRILNMVLKNILIFLLGNQKNEDEPKEGLLFPDVPLLKRRVFGSLERSRGAWYGLAREPDGMLE